MENRTKTRRTVIVEKRIVILAAILAFGAFSVLLFLPCRRDMPEGYEILEYNDGWSCSFSIDGETAESLITLPSSMRVPADTVITLERSLPTELEGGSGLVFRTRMQRVRVYVGEELIYKYPAGETLGGTVPSTWNFVKLPNDAAGKTVRICMESPFGNFSGLLPEIRIGNYTHLMIRVILEQFPLFPLSLLIGLTGGVILLITVLFRRYRLFEYQGVLGLLFVFLSLWLCGESRMPLIFIREEAQHYITLGSFFICPFFCAAYLRARWGDDSGRGTRVFFWVSGGCVSAAVLLQGGGILAFAEMIPVFHVLSAAALCCIFYAYIRVAWQNRYGVVRSEMVCIVLIFMGGIADIVRFYTGKNLLGIYTRVALLIYILNLFRLCVWMLHRKVRENRDLERKLEYSRAELMSSQIKPHFIYNTLNSIRTLIRTDPDVAYQTVYDFSIYLRANLDSVNGRNMILFSEELKHIRAYLNIEKIRFEDRLHTAFDIRTEAFPVPPLSIQPLVENAVKHGVCKKVGGGTVWIRSRETEDACIVEVEDDGVGFEWQKEAEETDRGHSHIGIRSIRFRVGVIADGTLKIESTPGEGTKVTVIFPKKGQRKEKELLNENHGRG